MTRHHERVVIVDGFAGPGRYLDGEEGSPLILLDCYLSHSYRPRMRSEIVYLFIEEREDRVAHLRNEVEGIELPPNVVVEVVHGRYEDEFRKGLDELRQAGHRLAPTFAFVDPFGYAQSSMDLTGRILEFPRCEALIYMPLPFVARFISREGQERAMTMLFDSDEWRQAIHLSGTDRRTLLHDLFRDQLLSHGSSFVRSFEIQSGPSTGYHLFFATSNELGLEKMKEAMWSVDPVAGQAFADSTRSDQLVLFEPEFDPAPLLDALRSHFGGATFSIEDAERFALLATPYLPSHLRRRTLAPEESAGRLEVLTPRNRIRTYPDGCRMRFLL